MSDEPVIVSKFRAAVRCTFQREADSKVEAGIAILREPCGFEVVVIIPDTAESCIDVPVDVYAYTLHHSAGCMTYPVETL